MRRPILYALLALALVDGAAALQPRSLPLGLDAYMPVPDDNPLNADRIAIGRRLFFDPILSDDRSMSCSTCHDPARAFSDSQAIAIGVYGRTGTRNVPAIVNRGYGASFFWDGRAASLEAQVLQPIDNPLELGAGRNEAMARVAAVESYRREFALVFGHRPNAADASRALASYVRSIVSGGSRYDEYAFGRLDALTAEERDGLRIFRGRGNCSACHIGPTFSDERFHNTGVAWKNGTLADEGRFAVTQMAADRGAFKTPTLREIARTPPYMHDGSLPTLTEVIAFYDQGARPNPALDGDIRPLGLSEAERRALETFLRSLSGRVVTGWPGPASGARRDY